MITSDNPFPQIMLHTKVQGCLGTFGKLIKREIRLKLENRVIDSVKLSPDDRQIQFTLSAVPEVQVDFLYIY